MSAFPRSRSTFVVTALAILLAIAQLAGPAVPAAAADEQMLVSTSATRSTPTPLAGASLHGNAFVFVTVPDPRKVVRVAFIVDGNNATRATDEVSPYDLAGTASDGTALPLDVSALGVGEHRLEANIRYSNRRVTLRSTFTVTQPPAPAEPQLLVSASADRSSPTPVQGAALSGGQHIFVTVPDPQNVVRVAFLFDGNTATRTTDEVTPYDLAGTASDGTARSLDISSLGVGQHQVEANVRYADRRVTLRSTFSVVEPQGYTRPDAPAPDSTEPAPLPTTEPTPDPDPTTGPQPEPEPTPSPTTGTQRLGLHVTADELATWRSRASSGPYRTQGDVSSNSPGDWARIQQGASAFMSDPDAGRWAGPTGNNPGGCVSPGYTTAEDLRFVPSHTHATELRDAAFFALVQQSRSHAVAVRDELLAQARVSGVDFNDRSRYCLGVIEGDNNPVFNISNWQTRLLYAYDYVRMAYPDLISSTDASLMDRWFAGSAAWMQEAADSKLDELFVNRQGGDYRLTGVASGTWSEILYYGGPEARTLQRRYNNRVAATLRFVTLVGVDQGNDSFTTSGRRFGMEFMQFSYYPQGAFGEFERWTDTRPILGWKYAVLAVGSVLTIADVLARAGDDSLYTYTTTEGALGTAGPHHSGAPKSLATMVSDLMRYVDHSYRRYGTATASRAGDATYLIDSVDELYGDQSVHDTMLTMSNRYYRDPYVRSVYQRTAPGAPGYPLRPTHGQGDPEGGEWGTYPGALFMFGGLEDAPRPYPGG